MVYTIHKSYVTHHNTGGIAVIQATSCGGVVIFRGKILVLYKNFKNKYEGWVLPRELSRKAKIIKRQHFVK